MRGAERQNRRGARLDSRHSILWSGRGAVMPYMSQPATCEKQCNCTDPHGDTRLIVVTGNVRERVTAVREIIRKQLSRQVVILPEAASIVFGGGFWRLDSLTVKRGATLSSMCSKKWNGWLPVRGNGRLGFVIGGFSRWACLLAGTGRRAGRLPDDPATGI